MKRIVLLIVASLLLSGCTVARGPAGEVVVGWKLGVLVETMDEGLGAIANTFIPGLGTLVVGSLAATGGVGGVVAAIGAGIRRRAAEKLAEEMDRKRKKADQQREAEALRAAIAEAKISNAAD